MKSYFTWLLAGTLAACAVGWIAARIHASGHAPVGLVSVGIGGLLGAALAYLANTIGFRCNVRLAVGTALIAVLCVIAEHTWLYRDYRGQWQEARRANAAVAMFRDEAAPAFDVYFAHEWQPILWISDAALIVVTSMCIVVFRPVRSP